jgi:hypothetical protein
MRRARADARALRIEPWCLRQPWRARGGCELLLERRAPSVPPLRVPQGFLPRGAPGLADSLCAPHCQVWFFYTLGGSGVALSEPLWRGIIGQGLLAVVVSDVAWLTARN